MSFVYNYDYYKYRHYIVWKLEEYGVEIEQVKILDYDYKNEE